MIGYFDAWIPRILFAIFVFAGMLKFHPRTQIDSKRWQLNLNLLRFIGLVEIVAAIALFWYPYWASAVLLVIMAGALGIGMKYKRYKEMIHPTITTFLLAFVLVRSL